MLYSIALVDSDLIGNVITDSMDTTDTYYTDAQIAILSDAVTGKVMRAFHTVDMAALITHFDMLSNTPSDNFPDPILHWDRENKGSYIIVNDGTTVTIPMIFGMSGKTEIYVADLDDFVVKVNVAESDGTFGSTRDVAIGFKKNNSTGYIIEELEALLKLY